MAPRTMVHLVSYPINHALAHSPQLRSEDDALGSGDNSVMGVEVACEVFREELSARLDGEDDPAAQPAVDKHLAGCDACKDWWQRAIEVTALADRAAALPTPKLSTQTMAAILAAAQQPRSEP